MDWIQIWRIAQVVLGIGLVIFVHESGHFLAARWCKVRVDVFSLGFGPRLFSWKRGDTTYQVAAIPLGGYVKMAGEESEEESATPDPNDLRSKSIGQRFLIFSGGVIMNVLFGVVIFPILFWVGIPFTQPLIGAPTPGGPAWQAGLESGTRVLEVNGQKVVTFSEILNEVALGDPSACELVIQRPGSEATERISLIPERSASRGLFDLGFPPALDPDHKVRIEEGSPAAIAGVATGDRWTSVEGARPGETPEEAFVSLAADGAPIRATFAKNESGEAFTVLLTPVETLEDAPVLFGVIAVTNQVAAIRGDSWGQVLQAGDRIIDLDGHKILSPSDLRTALQQTTTFSEIRFQRGGLHVHTRRFPHDVPPNASHYRADDLALKDGDGERRVRVVPRSAAAAAGLKSGDEILMVGDVPIDGTKTLLAALRAATQEERPASIVLLRTEESGEREITLEITAAPLPVLDYGINLMRAEYVYSESNPMDALVVGCGACVKFLQDSWLTLKGIFTDQVPGKNVGGPIAIGVIAHSFASVAWTKFFFFLCVLSMNLAFINVLPIPLLDGGHLFFLLIEKIKGSPVSDRIMGYSQLAGLVLIGFVFVYILYNDVQRTIG